MKKINIIIDPNGLHIESSILVRSNIELLNIMGNMLESFANMNVKLENDDESNRIAFWVMDSNYNNIMYVYVE